VFFFVSSRFFLFTFTELFLTFFWLDHVEFEWVRIDHLQIHLTLRAGEDFPLFDLTDIDVK